MSILVAVTLLSARSGIAEPVAHGLGHVFVTPVEAAANGEQSRREWTDVVRAAALERLAGSGWVLLTDDNVATVLAGRGVDPVEAFEKAQGGLDLARRLTARYALTTRVEKTVRRSSVTLTL
jgi:hypothetical protein